MSMHKASAGALQSKLPTVGTTIFAIMSAKAAAVGAINLSQGFPDFPADGRLFELAHQAMQAGHNQYAPPNGLPALRQQIAQLVERRYGARVDAEQEITVTSGATEALFSAVQALVQPGDEVILLEPAYDCYAPAIRLAGGTPVFVRLEPPSWRPDWHAVAAAITPRTKAIMMNNPHNPTGAVWPAEDLDQLETLVLQHGLWLLADEVYEHITFNTAHHSVLARPALASRALVFGSFGKSLHLTGWKLGYAIGPAALSSELRKVHQFTTFSTATPLQHAVAAYLQEKPAFYTEVEALYTHKQQLFAQLMEYTPFTPLPCQGTYFMCFSYEGVHDLSDYDMAMWLAEAHGVASIPLSAFYHDGHTPRVLRFCFAKQDATLEAAAQKLAAVPAR